MKQSFTNILDEALVQEFSGRSRDQVRQAFPQHAQRLDPLLKTARNLACVQDVQLPDAEVLRSDRQKFLQAVNQFENLNVSLGVVDRINKWIGAVIPFTAFKPRSPYQEKRKMNAIFANIALMIALLLASAGGTLAAAASSLPDSPLYPVKLTVEQIQIDLLVDPEKLAAQHLVLAQHRSQEILRQAQRGTPVQEGTTLRLQKNFNFALQYAAQLEDAQMAGLLKATATTRLAVLRPTPGSFTSSSRVCGTWSSGSHCPPSLRPPVSAIPVAGHHRRRPRRAAAGS